MTLLVFAIGVVLGAAIAVVLLRMRAGGSGELDGRFENQLRRLEDERLQLSVALKERMSSLSQETGRIAEQTQSLATALRRPGVRGQWGEATLKNVVEACGLVEQCDFDTQTHVSDGDGSIRPDMVVRLPGGGTVVVDAKVALDAYLDATECADEVEAERHLDLHVRHLRQKVDSLASKAYWQRFTRSPEMVVMFVASESALSAAAHRDAKLLTDAAAKKVMIATPVTLTALLQIVALGWREEKMAHHAEQVGELAVELCTRLKVFAGHLGTTSRGLDAAVRAHNNAIGSFESRVLPTVGRMEELGVGEAAEVAELRPVETATRAPAEQA